MDACVQTNVRIAGLEVSSISCFWCDNYFLQHSKVKNICNFIHIVTINGVKHKVCSACKTILRRGSFFEKADLCRSNIMQWRTCYFQPTKFKCMSCFNAVKRRHRLSSHPFRVVPCYQFIKVPTEFLCSLCYADKCLLSIQY